MRKRTGVPAWLKIQPELGIWMAKLRKSGASDTSVLTQGFVKQRKEWNRVLSATVAAQVQQAMDMVLARQLHSQVLLCRTGILTGFVLARGLKRCSNIWLGILGLTSEVCSWLPWFQSAWASSEPAGLEMVSFSQEAKLTVRSWCYLVCLFVFKKQGSLLKQSRAISLGHTPLAPPPAVLQLPGPGNFLSSQRKLLHPPVSMKKTITDKAWPFMHTVQFSLHSSVQRIYCNEVFQNELIAAISTVSFLIQGRTLL